MPSLDAIWSDLVGENYIPHPDDSTLESASRHADEVIAVFEMLGLDLDEIEDIGSRVIGTFTIELMDAIKKGRPAVETTGKMLGNVWTLGLAMGVTWQREKAIEDEETQ